MLAGETENLHAACQESKHALLRACRLDLLLDGPRGVRNCGPLPAMNHRQLLSARSLLGALGFLVLPNESREV